MSSVRLAVSLLCALSPAACSRPSEPPPGPASSTTVQLGASGVAPEKLARPGEHRNSVHDNDMPDTPPPRPPSDHATLIRASQILIAYKGALDAPASVQRDKEAARKLANSVDLEARAGANFNDLVAKYSDDPKSKADDGRLGLHAARLLNSPLNSPSLRN